MSGRKSNSFTLHQSGYADLESINRILIAAIQTWELPERVIRLTTPLLIYATLHSTPHQKLGIVNWTQQTPVKTG